LPITAEISPRTDRLTRLRLYDIVALLSTEEDVMTRPRRPAPSPKRKRLASREDTVITSMALPRGLHRKARMVALNLNWTLAEVVPEALDEWLVRHRSELTGGIGGRR
jgi:hypothetical protein